MYKGDNKCIMDSLAAAKSYLIWQLLPLYENVLDAIRVFSFVSFEWIPRGENRVTHGLCKWPLVDTHHRFCNERDVPPNV